MISLYYAPDNASLIIRIILEVIGLPYEAILVDRSAKAQNQATYLKLNPNGLIPVCIIDDQPVFETAAIALSLADMHQKMHIAINDKQRPHFLKWLFFLSNSLHTDLRQRFYAKKYVGNDPHALESFSQITLKRLCARLDILDTQYNETGSDYMFGEDASIVDVYLAVCMRWSQLYPVNDARQIKPDDYPFIKRMLCKLESRKPVIAACEKEGIRGKFFSNPTYSNPPEGVAL